MKRVLALALLLSACDRVEPPPYYAIDGDTIAVASGPHIRLAKIDAPELPGHCRPGRSCVAGDPYAAQHYLQQLLSEGDLVCHDIKRDYYNRRLADCWMEQRASRFNLSQAMYASGLVGLYEGNSHAPR